MRRTAPLLGGLVLLALLVSTGCASERYARPSSGEVQRGVASWYGPKFHGKPTASGEIYDMHGLTAAHKELPLQTVVAVRNLDNGREVTVRINDRGPFVRGRVLDLSYAAAQKLDMVGPGTARVEIRVVEVGDGRPGPTRFTRYAVQVGAYRDRQNALETKTRLATAGFTGMDVETADGWHRLRLGRFADRDEAEDLRRRIAHAGFEATVVTLH